MASVVRTMAYGARLYWRIPIGCEIAAEKVIRKRKEERTNRTEAMEGRLALLTANRRLG